ncbi:MAG TPA: proton-conducting transporter membrane subunit [Methanomassiliicoccales archaeon]|nr:proton-conducting transporter membrane subunit [Methanomassiliicoccales archaeon]HPR98396.1 proton-conducting transporter membrane subunit [Methanomassiliicoccales archaeon]
MLSAVLPALMLSLPLLGTALALLLRSEKHRVYSYLCSAASAVSAAFWSLLVLLNGTSTFVLDVPSAMGDYAIRLDALGALVLLITSLTFACVAMYSLFSREGITSRGASIFNLFMLSVLLAMVADHLLLLLVAWEATSLTSFLGAWGSREDQDTAAGWKYLAVTHFGAALIIVALVFLSTTSGEVRLSEMHGLSATLGPLTSAVVILLAFLGFGSKLGILPLHIWMPDLYSRSPSTITALLSTAASNVAVLVLVRIIFDMVGVGDQHMLSLLVMGMAATTALWAAWQALVQRDGSRVLAFSSMENMGLILLTIGAAMLFQSYGAAEPAAFAIMAAMFHLINHTVFKSLLLMGVGTVRRAAGEWDLEKLGGLARTMPGLSAVFLFGTLAVAALPPFSGFVSEWAMFKSLMHAEPIADPLIRIALPLAIAVMALCTAIAAAAYLRLFGFTFLGRPRSNGAARPRPLDRVEIFPLVPLAALCLLLGVASFPLLEELTSAVSPLVGATGIQVIEGYSINFLHQGGLNPLGLSALLAGAILVVFLVLRATGKRKVVLGDTWDCGTTLDRRTQYTPTGFSQPLMRVFKQVYRPHTEVKEEPHPSIYIRTVRFEQALPEMFTAHIYQPLVAATVAVAMRVKRMQSGSIQAYLAYLMIILIVLLVVLR